VDPADPTADAPLADPPPPQRKRRRQGPAAPCNRCLNIRWFLLSAAPLLGLGLLDPVLTNSLLSNLPDLRQLVLWFPLVIAGTFLYRLLTWRRQQDR
jgi:hypothetical protein